MKIKYTATLIIEVDKSLYPAESSDEEILKIEKENYEGYDDLSFLDSPNTILTVEEVKDTTKETK